MENEKRTILLGITGSIAAYKAADLTTRLIKQGFGVYVIMTPNACRFITPLTLQTLSGHDVVCDQFAAYNSDTVEHISLAKRADLLIIAPATANIIGKLACGIADDMLTTTALAIAPGKPKLIAPAMNTGMYENKIVQENLIKLKYCGYDEIAPKTSRLACGDVGKGALADIETIIAAVEGNFRD
ncbi:phosphopantothenoylcysteine decarboxylase [Clostridia bacterium]|nr:phosphopantothenoylcysteine decarboxylase [Clostridia bacterium]